MGWGPICCVTGLMAFLHYNLSLAKLRLKHFLHWLLLTTSFNLNFSQPAEFGLSVTTFIILFIHVVSSCQYKWRDNWSLFHLSTSSVLEIKSSQLLSIVLLFYLHNTFPSNRCMVASFNMWQNFFWHLPCSTTIEEHTSDTGLFHDLKVIYLCSWV